MPCAMKCARIRFQKNWRRHSGWWFQLDNIAVSIFVASLSSCNWRNSDSNVHSQASTSLKPKGKLMSSMSLIFCCPPGKVISGTIFRTPVSILFSTWQWQWQWQFIGIVMNQCSWWWHWIVTKMTIMPTSISPWSRVQPHTPRLSVSSLGKTLLGMTPTPRCICHLGFLIKYLTKVALGDDKNNPVDIPPRKYLRNVKNHYHVNGITNHND